MAVGSNEWLGVRLGLCDLVANIVNHGEAIGLGGSHEAADDLNFFKVVLDLLVFELAEGVGAIQ